ncbi:uncharacterized protein LY89DRAFT_783785 [Mollisia scopiformis]|uniref:Uncharacterized protein n=1 Tax=Mollisia scopiformis TaxID=149040 RepID=A0A194X3C4_MOLSC|nr:uncharacterized protein LY89DRAFT_783785 [Mollisia scopiformis]KUJ14693.1 hypothetical protein LY89DRAFT_783785 [Mollisia scopiformis]
MGKFLVRFGTFQGGSNIVMITGQRLFGFNLPPLLAAWLNQPSAVNAVENLDLGPDGHYALTYRRKDGSLIQLRSPGLEDWLRVPRLPLTTIINFAFGHPTGVLTTYADPRTGTTVWSTRDIPETLSTFMAQHGLQFNANIHEWDLGCDGDWMLITGTTSGYHVSDFVEGLIKQKAGNALHSGFCLNKMTRDQCYLELPNPYLYVSTAWISTLSAAINDTPVSSLVRGYYDDSRHVVVLPGEVLAAPPSQTGAFLTPDNFSTGLDIISNTMVVVGNVTGSAASSSGLCCLIM